MSKRFGTTEALDRVDLMIQPGELFTLLGPSGCGKTTLLRLLAGLEAVTEGAIYFGEDRVEEEPAYRRSVGMVFQNYALFPHMSVGENVRYGLKARHAPAGEIERRAQEALELVGLGGYASRTPGQLSGGQQQRVALARALVTRPALLLMDEPLSNLDARLRVAMREEIRRIVKEAGITTVYVTHDQEEALAISDRIGVMESGRLIQVDRPAEVYRRPASRKVAAFVGAASFLPGAVSGGVLSLAGQRIPLGAAAFEGAVEVGLRPEAVTLSHAAQEDPIAAGRIRFTGEVIGETYLGPSSHIAVRIEGAGVVTALTAEPPGRLPPGTRAELAVAAADLMLFGAESGEAIR